MLTCSTVFDDTIRYSYRPRWGIVEGMNRLTNIIPQLDKRFRYVVEVRDSSWFQDLTYSFFANVTTERHILARTFIGATEIKET